MSLGDLYAGRLTLRRFSVLVYGLPAGCGTWVAQGGQLAWSAEVSGLMAVKNAVETFQMSFAKNPKPVPMVEPPAWGYLEVEADRRATQERRAQRFIEKQSGTTD